MTVRGVLREGKAGCSVGVPSDAALMAGRWALGVGPLSDPGTLSPFYEAEWNHYSSAQLGPATNSST